MTSSPKDVCLGWDCPAYESDMTSYARTDAPDYVTANIGLNIQDKCAEVNGCFYAQRLGAIAQVADNPVAIAEGAQDA